VTQRICCHHDALHALALAALVQRGIVPDRCLEQTLAHPWHRRLVCLNALALSLGHCPFPDAVARRSHDRAPWAPSRAPLALDRKRLAAGERAED
jgi:hypothetical protein